MGTLIEYSAIETAGTFGIGAFGLRISEDGGLVDKANFSVGYGRRSIEQIVTALNLSLTLSYTDKIDFLAAPAYNFITASAVEDLLGVEIPERADYIRVVLLELNRINSHLYYLANLARAVGQPTAMNYCMREREKFSDVLEMYSGSRFGFESICIGGVAADATDGWFFKIEKALDSVKVFLHELDAIFIRHPFFEGRAGGLGKISQEDALKWNLTGPNQRATGLPSRDLRRLNPYAAYGKLPESRKLEVSGGLNGDVLARIECRRAEILDSCEIIQSAYKKIPSGNFRVRVSMSAKMGAGYSYREVEGPRGEASLLLESVGDSFSMRFFTPSAMAMQILPKILIGERLEDVFLIMNSLDISISEVDK